MLQAQTGAPAPASSELVAVDSKLQPPSHQQPQPQPTPQTPVSQRLSISVTLSCYFSALLTVACKDLRCALTFIQLISLISSHFFAAVSCAKQRGGSRSVGHVGGHRHSRQLSSIDACLCHSWYVCRLISLSFLSRSCLGPNLIWCRGARYQPPHAAVHSAGPARCLGRALRDSRAPGSDSCWP